MLSASAYSLPDDTLPDLHNSSYDTQPHSLTVKLSPHMLMILSFMLRLKQMTHSLSRTELKAVLVIFLVE